MLSLTLNRLGEITDDHTFKSQNGEDCCPVRFVCNLPRPCHLYKLRHCSHSKVSGIYFITKGLVIYYDAPGLSFSALCCERYLTCNPSSVIKQTAWPSGITTHSKAPPVSHDHIMGHRKPDTLHQIIYFVFNLTKLHTPHWKKLLWVDWRCMETAFPSCRMK